MLLFYLVLLLTFSFSRSADRSLQNSKTMMSK